MMTSDVDVNRELDIRSLYSALWQGKRWIISIALLFALSAWIYSLIVPQRWSTIAITDYPTVNMLDGFYSQRQLLRAIDAKNRDAETELPIIEMAYREFLTQLSSHDTRRDFWIQTGYYQNLKSGNAKKDAALLTDLIKNIQFTAAEPDKNTRDTVKLTAESAADANNLLRQYVAFASQRAALHLNNEVAGDWKNRNTQFETQIKRQEIAAKSAWQRQVQRVEQALKIAQQQNIEQSETEVSPEQLPDSAMFLSGKTQLQARLENLQANGPDYSTSYDEDRAMQATLAGGPVLNANFQTYRYLRTPEEPVTRDSPRGGLLMVMWGISGILIGMGIALVRRRPGA